MNNPKFDQNCRDFRSKSPRNDTILCGADHFQSQCVCAGKFGLKFLKNSVNFFAILNILDNPLSGKIQNDHWHLSGPDDSIGEFVRTGQFGTGKEVLHAERLQCPSAAETTLHRQQRQSARPGSTANRKSILSDKISLNLISISPQTSCVPAIQSL